MLVGATHLRGAEGILAVARREIETIVNKTGMAVRLTTYVSGLTTYSARRKALPVSGKRR